MTYTYYDYLENWYEDWYEYDYWPYYYAANYTGTYPPSQYEQPYPMEIFNPIFWGICLLCAVLSIIIACLIFYQMRQASKQGRLWLHRFPLLLTVTCVLFHVLWCLTDVVSYYYWYISWQGPQIANRVEITWNILWCLSKISLYFVFMNRYYIIFRAACKWDAAKKTKKCLLFGSFSIAIVVQIGLIAVFLFFYFHPEYDHDKAKRIYLNAAWSFWAIDLLLMACIGYLLNRSILQLIVTGTNLDLQSRDKLTDLTTRIALCCIISMSSSFVYQFAWNMAEELENFDIKWFTATWSIDAIINMLCIYFSMGISKEHYEQLCLDGTCAIGTIFAIPCKLCQCHACCKRCIEKIADKKIRKMVQREMKVRKITEQETTNNTTLSTPDQSRHQTVPSTSMAMSE